MQSACPGRLAPGRLTPLRKQGDNLQKRKDLFETCFFLSERRTKRQGYLSGRKNQIDTLRLFHVCGLAIAVLYIIQ